MRKPTNIEQTSNTNRRARLEVDAEMKAGEVRAVADGYTLTNSAGYGYFGSGAVMQAANRYAYMLYT